MLTWPQHPDLFLAELKDLSLADPPAPISAHLGALSRVVAWAEEYLCRPHPELGREGPVCPFVQAAMRKGLFLLAVCAGRGLDQASVEERLRLYRDWFLALDPCAGNDAAFKTILVLFPDLAHEDLPLIEATQAELKPAYVEKGLMIGEFHFGPPRKAGLWNPAFRPLASPVPLLAIRHMVPTDFAFLRDEKALVRTYLRRFGAAVPAHLRDTVRQAAERFGIPFGGAEAMEVVHARVRQALASRRTPVRVHRHADLPQPIHGPHDVAAALGYSLDRITKSLFLRCQCHGKYSVVVAPVLERTDLGRLARQLGCTRLELASLPELSALLGYSPGGVSPIGIEGIQVLMDRSLLEQPTVLVAAGEVAVEIEIEPAALVEITGATVLSVTAGAGTEAAAR